MATFASESATGSGVNAGSSNSGTGAVAPNWRIVASPDITTSRWLLQWSSARYCSFDSQHATALVTNDVALYGHWICPFVTRVPFALAQRGVAHDLVDLPPSAVRGPDFVLSPEFVEHSPQLEIPMVALRAGADVDYLADSIPVLERPTPSGLRS